MVIPWREPARSIARWGTRGEIIVLLLAQRTGPERDSGHVLYARAIKVLDNFLKKPFAQETLAPSPLVPRPVKHLFDITNLISR